MPGYCDGERGARLLRVFCKAVRKMMVKESNMDKDENQCVNGTDVIRVPEKVNWKKRGL